MSFGATWKVTGLTGCSARSRAYSVGGSNGHFPRSEGITGGPGLVFMGSLRRERGRG
ncbi:hypothetical protein ACQ4WX_45800 [Streptomyces lasalocidi]